MSYLTAVSAFPYAIIQSRCNCSRDSGSNVRLMTGGLLGTIRVQKPRGGDIAINSSDMVEEVVDVWQEGIIGFVEGNHDVIIKGDV